MVNPIELGTAHTPRTYSDALPSWQERVRVYHSMITTDAEIAGTLRSVMQPCISARWQIDSNGAKPHIATAVAQDLDLPLKDGETGERGYVKTRFNFQEFIRHALYSLAYGFMPFEQVYRWNGDRFAIRKLAPRLPQTLTHDGLDITADGGLQGIRQRTTNGESVYIPIDKLVMFSHARIGSAWEGQSLLRPIYANWLLKRTALESLNTFVQRSGAGVPIYQAPATDGYSSEEYGEMLETGLEMARRFETRDGGGVAIPHGSSLSFASIGGNVPDYLGIIRYHDSKIAASMVAHFTSLATARNGSRALGSTLIENFYTSLNATAQEFARTITAHVIEDLVDLNWPGEQAPKIIVDDIGVDTQALAQMVANLTSAGVIRPDWETEEMVREKTGLPKKFGGTPSTQPKTKGRKPWKR